MEQTMLTGIQEISGKFAEKITIVRNNIFQNFFVTHLRNPLVNTSIKNAVKDKRLKRIKYEYLKKIIFHLKMIK